MGYKLFNFGALWLNDDIQHVPVQLGKDGDIPQYDNKSSIFIGAGSQTETIVWVKPDDINLLIADRILLGNVSWVDLEKNGFVKGRETIIHGQRFRCRLLRVGLKNDEPNEWDSILDETCDANFLWHCKRTAFWGIDTSDGKVVKMYTLLYKEKPVHPNSKDNIVITAREAECIKLTDKYFGDEYLIPWIISNGVAIASKALAYISV